MRKELVKRPDEEHLRLPGGTWLRRTAATAIAAALTWLVIGLGAPYWLSLGIPLGCLGFFATRAAARRDDRIEEMSPVVDLLNRGELDAASTRLTESAKRENNVWRASTMVLLGWTRLRQQRFEEALALLLEVVNSPSTSLLRTVARTLAAEVLALQGQLDDADEFARKAHDARRRAPASVAVVWCRLGKLKKVLSLKDMRVSKRFRPHSVHEGRKLWLMKAWARTQLGDDNSDREHAEAQPAFEGEYDYLTDNWPEVKQFLEDHPWTGLRAVTTQLPQARVLKS